MGIAIKEAKPGLFLFKFFHQVDLQRVLDTGTWSFDGHLLLLHHLQPGVDPSVPLHHTLFWVHVYDLPPGFMAQGIGEQVGNYIGRFLECDESNDVGLWRLYMRIRVLVDVRVELKKRKKIRKKNGE